MLNNMSLIILSISFFYSLSLNIIYFSKKHVKTYETRIFSILMVSNLLGIILEYSCIFSIYGLGIDSFITLLFNKLFLIYLLTFAFIFTTYAIFITIIGQDESYSIKHNIFRFTVLCTFIVNTLLLLILPIYIYNEFGITYSYGPSVNLLYVMSGVCVAICLISMSVKYKNVKKKKLIPLLAYIIGALLTTLIQKLNPALTLATSMETFLIFLMYNTIENPDVKMIQELEVAKDQANRANQAKTDFLSSMSHEIRTPLNAIVGFSDCIMDAKDLNEAKDNAQDIVNASKTLLEIVNGILDISKIEAGKIEIVNSNYNAPNIFLELAKLITPKMREKGLDFSFNIAGDIPNTLCGDHANLKKVITNLLSNACKYTERGFVHYEVNCVNSNGVCKLIISVEDSGQGIKNDDVDKLFTKFQRFDEEKNATIEGTGLGLAITKQLVELMGGRILVHTVYGQGSKFTVVVNQKIEKDDDKNKKRLKSTLDLKNVKILLVDDTLLNLKVATKLFQKYNANMIDTCDSGFLCLEKIKSGEVYDIILLDDMMPKMSGVETLKKLREIPGFNIPVVAMTANAISGMREKYIEDGFNDYLAKPIEKEQLIHVLNNILGRSITESIEIPREEIAAAIRNDSEKFNQKVIPVGEIETLEMEDDNMNQFRNMTEKDENIASNSIFDGYKYLENNGVDLEYALSLLGDIEMYNMTISDFLEEVEGKWNNITLYKNNNDMKNYTIDVHSLKSDCKYLGFMKLADISYQHEIKSRENDLEFVIHNFEELEKEYKKVLEITKTYVKNIK